MSTTLPISREWNPSLAISFQFGVPAILLLLAAASVITIDYPLSRSATEQGWTDEVHEALQSIEPFGSPYGMAVVLLAIMATAPGRFLAACRIGSAGIAGGLCAGVIKLLVCRARPRHFDFDQAAIFDSFQGLLPLLSRGGGWQSFPSAHTATAVAFAVALAHHFPRARWLCYSLAALVGLQRIESGQHFASDVFVGAAVGWMTASLVLLLWQGRKKTEHSGLPDGQNRLSRN